MSPGWSGSFLTHRDLKGQEGKSQAKIKATGLPGSGTHARPYDEKDLDKFEKQITGPGWLEPGEEWRGRGETVGVGLRGAVCAVRRTAAFILGGVGSTLIQIALAATCRLLP